MELYITNQFEVCIHKLHYRLVTFSFLRNGFKSCGTTYNDHISLIQYIRLLKYLRDVAT